MKKYSLYIIAVILVTIFTIYFLSVSKGNKYNSVNIDTDKTQSDDSPIEKTNNTNYDATSGNYESDKALPRRETNNQEGSQKFDNAPQP